MARYSLAPIFGCLLACTVLLTPATGRAAEEDTKASEAVAVNRRKLERIIIPKLEFREATFREALDFLIKKAAELDTDSAEGGRGLNVVMKLEAPGGGGIPGQPVANPDEHRITVSLTNVSLLEALRYVTTLANLRFEIEPNLISIGPLIAPAGGIVTKEWKIPRDLIPGVPPDLAKATAGPEATVKNVDRETAKNWLIANGVTFDGAASAVYVVKSSRLIVRNTQDQVDLVDTIIQASQGGGPVLMEIECRLVEIEREQIKDVNLDAVLQDFNNPGTSKFFLDDMAVTKTGSPDMFRKMGGGAHPDSPEVVEDLSAPGSSPLSGIFTDPQFQLVLRMLVNKKGADVLAAPKITVKSGQPAAIRFIRQFSNPPEDVPPQVRSIIPLVNESPAAAAKVVPTTRPGHNEDRNVAVTLEVEPVVGPDGYTIDLNLTSQVTEFDGLASYIGPFRWMNPSFGPAGRIVTPQPMPPPIFSTRKVTTSVSIFDGSTVVLGDLLHEEVPPIFGRNAPGDPDKSPKRRVIAFVTVRLVNAASNPVRADNEKEEVIETKTPPERPPSPSM